MLFRRGLFVSLSLLVHVVVAQTSSWDRALKGGKAPAKRCLSNKNNAAPNDGDKCTGGYQTCLFGSKECPSAGTISAKKCTCTSQKGRKGRSGMWSCVDESCPGTTVGGDPNNGGEASVEGGVFRSSSARAFQVTLNLLTPAVLVGYTSTQELVADLTQAVRFFVNTLIDEQSRYDKTYYPVPDQPVPGTAGGAGPTESGSPSAEGATDFETNNQEDGVDEADFVKSDGTYVYAVYGDAVVVWDAITGDVIRNYTLPPINITYDPNLGGGGFGGGIEIGIPRPPIFYQPKPQILGMSLEMQRLVLYVQGYGNEVRAAAGTKSAFSNAFETRIIVLDTSTLPGSFDVVTQKDIHGYYRDARAIGSDIHVVTTCSLDYYGSVAQPLYRWNAEYADMNSTEYIAAATAIAGPLIDQYVTILTNDVVLFGIPNIPKISIWQTDLGNNTNIVEYIYSSGIIQAYTQLTSFSVDGLVGDLTVSTAGAFTPSEWGYTYGVNGNLIFAAQGYNWAPDLGGSGETTYLLGFALNGASAVPSFLGSVPGYINNQYNLHIYNGTMSIATTVTMWWPVWEERTDQLGNLIWPSPTFTTNNTVFVFALPTATAPLTEVGRVPNLGKEGERFTAVRFFRNICYAVTFRQTDPFYVISTDPNNVRLLGELQISGFSSYLHSINDDDTLLVAVGQEADDQGQILGTQITLFDATFPNAPTLLYRFAVELERDVWSSSTVQWDYKAFRYLALGPDFGIVIIPLTVVAGNQENTGGNFDGFLAFDVSRVNGISQRLNVTHVASQDFYSCYYPANLPERSLVFNGDLTTMKGHSVISTDLDTGETRWVLNMAKPVEQTECVFWLY